MQPLQICIGPTIRIGRESWCLPYAGFFCIDFMTNEFKLSSKKKLVWDSLVPMNFNSLTFTA